MTGIQLICREFVCNWRTISRFAFVGATGAIVNISLLWILTKFSLIYYIFSAIIATEVSIIWNFYLNSKITFCYKFEDRSDIVIALLKYNIASLIGLSINILILFVLTEYFKIFYVFSEIAAIILAFGFNYLLSIIFVWNKKD